MSQSARFERFHIAVFGRRNTGKSSLVNALLAQDVSIVSSVAGTTTDTVWKNIELPGVGATVIGDTAGYDDEGAVGELRVDATKKVLSRIDLAVLLLHDNPKDNSEELEWCRMFEQANLPVILLLGQSDRFDKTTLINTWQSVINKQIIPFSSVTREGLDKLLSDIAAVLKSENDDDITGSLVKAGDIVLLVMPQDSQAPKGRLIQPQVQTLRNLLDKHAIPLCCAPEELPSLLDAIKAPPSLIITDSQAFAYVERLKPEESLLTSFSVLMARHKGDIDLFRKGADALMALPSDGKVLIAEACSHIPRNEDIGRVKLPRMLCKRFGDGISIEVVSGNDYPDDLSKYDIIIHCGACMFTKRHVMARVSKAVEQGVPVTNYGIAIAALSGILDKVTY